MRSLVKHSKFNLVFSFNSTHDLVYNPLYGSLLLVDKEVGLAIKRGDVTRVSSDPELYSQLLSAGVLVEDSVAEEELYALESRESRFTSKAIAMFLSLTSKCNLACKYCYQSLRPSEGGRDLSESAWGTLYGFLERRVKVSAKAVAIALYGGEPLLNASMAKRVARDLNKLIAEYGVKGELTLVTNGTVFNRDVEEVVSLVDTIQVTVDGPREVHNERRPFKWGGGSFDSIMENTLRFLDNYSKRVGVRVNVDEHNIDYAKGLVDFLVELGLEKKLYALDFSPVLPDQAETYNPLKTSRNYHEYIVSISRKIVENLEYAVDKGFKITKVFLKGPCMCKYVNCYAVDEELNLYTCPAYMYGEPVGKVLSEKAVVLSPERFTPVVYDPECVKGCKYAPMCYGGCIYLRSKNVPTCMRTLYGEEYLERLLRAYAISRYREVVGYA